VTILCVDPGLVKTAAVFMKDGVPVFWKEIGTKPADSLQDRVDQVCSWLEELKLTAVLNGWDVDYCILELLHLGSRSGDRARVMNMQAIRDLAILTGAIMRTLRRCFGPDVRLQSPSGVYRINRQKVNRETKKRINQAIVKLRYNIMVSDHLADAMLLSKPAEPGEIVAGWLEVRRADDKARGFAQVSNLQEET
jgi:hypothetical protein